MRQELIDKDQRDEIAKLDAQVKSEATKLLEESPVVCLQFPFPATVWNIQSYKQIFNVSLHCAHGKRSAILPCEVNELEPGAWTSIQIRYHRYAREHERFDGYEEVFNDLIGESMGPGNIPILVQYSDHIGRYFYTEYSVQWRRIRRARPHEPLKAYHIGKHVGQVPCATTNA